MPSCISRTNRKGQTFHLQKRTTRNGRTCYVFTREHGPGCLTTIPDGYEVNESVHGNVTLRKRKKRPILPAELEIVRAVLP